jgi:hypothetical protein
MDNEGNRRLTLAASARGAAKQRGVPRPADQVERQRRTLRERGHGDNLRPGFNGLNVRPWTAAEDELALTLPGAEAAARTGRTVGAVWTRRSALRAAGRRG